MISDMFPGIYEDGDYMVVPMEALKGTRFYDDTWKGLNSFKYIIYDGDEHSFMIKFKERRALEYKVLRHYVEEGIANRINTEMDDLGIGELS